MRFIPVANNTQLVAPSRLFARLRVDLAPFAFEVPAAFIRYIDLLKDLGARDSPTPADMLAILQVCCIRGMLQISSQQDRLPKHLSTTPFFLVLIS